jgi:hypothetical protein
VLSLVFTHQRQLIATKQLQPLHSILMTSKHSGQSNYFGRLFSLARLVGLEFNDHISLQALQLLYALCKAPETQVPNLLPCSNRSCNHNNAGVGLDFSIKWHLLNWNWPLDSSHDNIT